MEKGKSFLMLLKLRSTKKYRELNINENENPREKKMSM